jgi:hypothetical protein
LDVAAPLGLVMTTNRPEIMPRYISQTVSYRPNLGIFLGILIVPKLVSKLKCASRGELDAFSAQHEAEIRPSVLECEKAF